MKKSWSKHKKHLSIDPVKHVCKYLIQVKTFHYVSVVENILKEPFRSEWNGRCEMISL